MTQRGDETATSGTQQEGPLLSIIGADRTSPSPRVKED